MSTAICWFKNDLRLTDKPTLIEAARGRQLLCVYCIDTRHAANSVHGSTKLGPHRAAFMRQSLNDLASQLK